MPTWEAVIGLEVHAQLRTRSKIFCACPTDYGAEPNSQVCPVCLGHPGALPVLNERALALAVRAALALGCTVHEESVFERKNYFYPDLPKGYQISQYERPLATGGAVAIEAGGGTREIGLVRLHLEEDAGRSVHDGGPDSDVASYVDLNRAGVPLVEIVSRPDVRSPEEAYLFLERLRSVLRYVGACDGNMEEGSLRCDANVSVRSAGETALGTRTEVKNLNSFRNVERALAHEVARQVAVLDADGAVEQETRLWDAAAFETRPMRGKEEAEDYRYFPDPDLPPVVVSPDLLEEAARDLPELPHARKYRFVERYGLGATEAHVLTLERALAEHFERVAELCGDPRVAANFELNDVLKLQHEAGLPPDVLPVTPERLAALIRLVAEGTVSGTAARRDVLPEVARSGREPAEIVAERGLERIADPEEIATMARRVVSAWPDQVAAYRGGKTGVLGFLVGKVLKESRGKADPAVVNAALREILGS